MMKFILGTHSPYEICNFTLDNLHMHLALAQHFGDLECVRILNFLLVSGCFEKFPILSGKDVGL